MDDAVIGDVHFEEDDFDFGPRSLSLSPRSLSRESMECSRSSSGSAPGITALRRKRSGSKSWSCEDERSRRFIYSVF